MGKAKVSYEVLCQTHGTLSQKGDNRFKVVRVPQFTSKAQKLHGGCPMCRSEQNKV